MLKRILIFLFVTINLYTLWAITAVYTASDIHYYANDLDNPENEKSLNYLQAERGFESMRQQILETIKKQGTNVDSVAVVINGDPFNRSTDAVRGTSRGDKPGFETRNIDDRKELIKKFANHVVSKITDKNDKDNDGLSCEDKSNMINGHLKCQVNLPDGKVKSFDIAFKSNIGDHEIEKLPSTTKISEKQAILNELPEYCTNKIEPETMNEINDFDVFIQTLKDRCGIKLANYMPAEKKLIKDSFSPDIANTFANKLFADLKCKDTITQYIKTENSNLTYDKFHEELKNKCKIEVDDASGNYLCKGATYKWANGDDVQKLRTVGVQIANAWKESKWFVPESVEAPLTMVDPRVGHIMVMQDGQPYIFAHVDKVLSPEEKKFQEQSHAEQGHLPQFQATVYKGFADLDPRSDPRFANLVVFTGDSHVPRYSLPMAFAADGQLQLAQDLVTITATRSVINGGSLSSPLRQQNGLNGYASYVPGIGPKIISLNYAPSEGDGYGYSNRMIGGWLAAANVEKRIEIENAMIADLKKAQFDENNPSRHFQDDSMSQISNAYKLERIPGLLKKLHELDFTLRKDYFTTVKFILKCGRNKNKSEVKNIFKALYVGPDQDKSIDASINEQDKLSKMDSKQITDLRNF